ncbi:unnamed protein product [Urochloa decumbens]|uniref:F-box domain-containing protein n=1 Tax=Urochloa decumbens TaxID=240449 RepID=A0ABC9FU78_9POAL
MAAEDAVAAKRGQMDMMSALPEHILQEVLSCVGTVKDLFKLAATCRRWLGRFTDRAFLREILCPVKAQGLLGFFLQDACQGVWMGRRKDAAQQLASACSFLPAPGSPLGPSPTARALTSSLVTDGRGAFDYAVPLAARRGIVLMQRLLVATVDTTDRRVVHLHSYFAATCSWSAPTLCLANGGGFYPAKGQRSTIIHQGAAHWLWLYRDTGGQHAGDDDLYKLSVQLGGAAAGPIFFAFTRIPVRSGGNPLLCVTGDGELAVVCTYIWHVAVSTCRQQQNAGGGHAEASEHTAFTIPAAVPYPDTPTLRQPIEKWFHLSRGSILVHYRSSAVFVVDLHSKTVEKVMDCFLHLFADQLNRTAVPYEMDLLVDFFMSKLDGLSFTGSSSV